MREDIIQLLDKLGIKYRWLDHPAVFTVQDAVLLEEKHTPIKNLLVQEEGGGKKYLIIMVGNERLNMKSLKHTLGAKKLRFASSETLMDTFGVEPGSVSVFGMLHHGAIGTLVIVDEEVLNSAEDIGFHPNDNTSSIFISPNSLEPILYQIGCSYKILKLY